VIERTVKAVNYQYRNGQPTQIDFRGTVLLPQSRGQAAVESKAGRTEIDAKFDHVAAPSRFGNEYLTYVLWAITPEGHAKNLGEVLANGSDKASLHVTTDLQAFGLIVTAEPYAAVRLPSDIVVLENEIRPDTIGKIEPIQAKYELLPRGHYTYEVPSEMRKGEGNARMLSFDRYESLLEVYQAQNAVQIAKSQDADKYAPDTYQRAAQLLKNAQDLDARKADRSTVVMAAREAAQTAEDARAIALQRKQNDELAQVRSDAEREKDLRAKAEAEAMTAKAQASADRAQLDQERAARERAESQAAVLSQPAPPPPPAPTVVVRTVPAPDTQKAAARMDVLRQLSMTMTTLDTPRGLVVTLHDGEFRGGALNPSVSGNLSRVAQVVASHPGLTVDVEGYSDNPGEGGQRSSYERASAVRDALVRSGVPANAISARGMGDSRPVASNASATGREQNRRVEIVVAGSPIGSLASWDKTYPVAPRE
jgi:flagellar motor protein MotB